MLTIIWISSTCAATSRPSSTSTIIAAACTRRSAINRRRSSSSNSRSATTSAGATMSFFRHGEDYRPDGTPAITRSGPQTAPLTIGFDESPAGYSLASCSPAELASASPADADSNPRSNNLRSETYSTQVCQLKTVSTEFCGLSCDRRIEE